MKILVTGGAGFIGSNFMHYEVKKYPNDKFVCIDALTYAGNYNNIKELEKYENFKFVHGDITDRELIRIPTKQQENSVNLKRMDWLFE